ncbi:MAG: CDP-diacylglycerol--glycerol-3-phosphate 3-phosphatidyltransferase [Erysipelotrichaceae bacterium]|nr:CDP-diacylglycerol--glycerol-3-phosphate 3-phosphatidyltransferase [Erysipelotrichaceae bacterium]
MNLPNKLTVFRILLVPILVLVWLFPFKVFNVSFYVFNIANLTLSVHNLILLAIFVIASITDYLDGRIARSRNMVTSFGKFLDPIADKLLINTSFILLAYTRAIPVVPVLIMLARDTIVDCVRMIAAQNGKVVSAGMLGKTKTVLQMITIILTLLNNLPFEIWHLDVASLFLWAATIVSVMSGFEYFKGVKDDIFKTI